MKNYLTIIFIITTLLLTGCSNKTDINTTKISEPIETNNTYIIEDIDINNIQKEENRILNKTEEKETYTIYIYSNNMFSENYLPVPTVNAYETLAKSISEELQFGFTPTKITKIDKKIYINFNKEDIDSINGNIVDELKLLKSYAKTFSENTGCLIHFTINEKDYTSTNFYFNREEHYPL